MTLAAFMDLLAKAEAQLPSPQPTAATDGDHWVSVEVIDVDGAKHYTGVFGVRPEQPEGVNRGRLVLLTSQLLRPSENPFGADDEADDLCPDFEP